MCVNIWFKNIEIQRFFDLLESKQILPFEQPIRIQNLQGNTQFLVFWLNSWTMCCWMRHRFQGNIFSITKTYDTIFVIDGHDPFVKIWEDKTYSCGNSCCNKALFMKQKCQILMGVRQNENAATPLRTRGINTTHQHFQMRCTTLIYLKGLKSYQPSNLKCVVSVVKQTLHFYFNQ